MTTHPQQEVSPTYADDVFTGTSPAVDKLRLQVARIAPHFRIALLTGEAGCGKRAVALQMHHCSPVAALPFTVLDAGEFAREGMPSAAEGTLYLPRLDLLAPPLQDRMLRALKALPRETRVLAGSQSDLRGMVSAGRMRHDLYESVGALEIRIAPLRDRREDVENIAAAMLRRMFSDISLAPEEFHRLRHSGWPGNLKELWSVCEHFARTGELRIRSGFSSDYSPMDAPVPARLKDAMLRHVMDVLQRCSGNKLRAAEVLGISRSTLYRMLDSQPLNPA